MKELAEHILYVAHKNKKSITNLQLQKILYFSLRYSVPEIGLRAAIQTYDEPFIIFFSFIILNVNHFTILN